MSRKQAPKEKVVRLTPDLVEIIEEGIVEKKLRGYFTIQEYVREVVRTDLKRLGLLP